VKAKRVLFGNEFGAGRGHNVLLQSISVELSKFDPHLESRFVLPPHARSSMPENTGPCVFPSELAMLPGHNSADDRRHVHGLCELWMQDNTVLPARLRMWQAELASFKPDLVVADYAPSLSMAANGKVPCFVVGNGYTMPPPERQNCLSKNHSKEPDDAPSDARWLEKLNAVLGENGANKLNFLPEVNRGDAYGLFTIPLFDIYWEVRQQEYLGVHHPGGSPVPSDTNDGTALVYFSMINGIQRIIEGLIESQIPTSAYFGHIDTTLQNRLHGTNVVLSEKPFDLSRDLPGRALTVHSGSLGMAAAGLYAGLPQVGLFQHSEGEGNCRSFDIAQIGVSAWSKNVTSQQVADMMHKAKASSLMRNYATVLSHRYARFRSGNAAAKAAAIAMKLMG
jgi:rhamnosyltransferase subunit B